MPNMAVQAIDETGLRADLMPIQGANVNIQVTVVSIWSWEFEKKQIEMTHVSNLSQCQRTRDILLVCEYQQRRTCQSLSPHPKLSDPSATTLIGSYGYCPLTSSCNNPFNSSSQSFVRNRSEESTTHTTASVDSK
jgi:hypothetical protein